MNTERQSRNTIAVIALLAGLSLAAPSMAAKDEFPDVTTDGLKRVESKKIQALYVLPDASLSGYKSVKILDCPVAFRKNWMRDYNADMRELSARVSHSDMDRIKKNLSELFKEQFTKTLQDAGYTVVDDIGEDVLLLRPAIINLDVTSPDLKKSVGIRRSYTASAGSMTLYMELYDSATSQKIAEMADAEGAADDGHFQYTNSVSNKAEAGRMLRKWAGLLVDALDEANAAQAKQ